MLDDIAGSRRLAARGDSRYLGASLTPLLSKRG